MNFQVIAIACANHGVVTVAFATCMIFATPCTISGIIAIMFTICEIITIALARSVIRAITLANCWAIAVALGNLRNLCDRLRKSWRRTRMEIAMEETTGK